MDVSSLGVLEMLLLVEVVARLAGGGRPASLPALIEYLIAMPIVRWLPRSACCEYGGALRSSRWRGSPCGIGEDWTPRELRHIFVSIMSDNDVPIQKIADLGLSLGRGGWMQFEARI